MKLLNENVLKALSKMVNLKRVEILTWHDVDRFEKDIDKLCHINGAEGSDSDDEKWGKRSRKDIISLLCKKVFFFLSFLPGLVISYLQLSHSITCIT